VTLLLPAMVLIPLAGALACAVRPQGRVLRYAQSAALLTALLAVVLVALFNPRDPNVQLAVSAPWIADLGASLSFGVDGISLLFIAMVAWITPAILHAAGGHEAGRRGAFLGWLLVLESLTIGAFAARDGFLFLVFWDLQLVPVLFLAGAWGGLERARAAQRYVLTAAAGSVALMVALLGVFQHQRGSSDEASTGLAELAAVGLPPELQVAVFGALALAFGVRLAVFPLHAWLPALLARAPAPAAALIAGTTLPLGLYGFLTFSVALAPQAAAAAAPWGMTLAGIGAAYSALVALGQRDARGVAAYALTGQAGIAALGMFALNAAGLRGAVGVALSLGLTTSALLLLAGMLHDRRGTWRTDAFGGLARIMPRFAVLGLVVTLAAAGAPGLSAFAGLALSLLGTAQVSFIAASVAAGSAAIGAVALMLSFQRVMFGPLSGWENKGLPDLSRRELVALAPLLALILLLGLAPGPALDRAGPAVARAAAAVAPYLDEAP